MKPIAIARYALTAGIAALLAGCGGSQIGAPRAMPQVRIASTDLIGDTLPYHKTFKYTGSEQLFIVPSAITSIRIIALEARPTCAHTIVS